VSAVAPFTPWSCSIGSRCRFTRKYPLESMVNGKIKAMKLTLSPQERYEAPCRLRAVRLPPLARTV